MKPEEAYGSAIKVSKEYTSKYILDKNWEVRLPIGKPLPKGAYQADLCLGTKSNIWRLITIQSSL